MRIKFWGTRGSIPVPGKDTTIYGGNTTCVEITLQSGRTVIIDAGTGIRPLGEKLVADNNIAEIYLLITHIHWDHVLGFPFFNPIFDSSDKIIIDGHRTCLKGLKATFDNKTGDGFFPIKFDDLKAKIHYLDKLSKGAIEIDGTVIDSIPLQHPSGGLGFRFSEGDRSLVFLTDNELQVGGDPRQTPNEYIEFCRDADILIHDSQYTPEEIDGRKGWGHSDYRSSFDLAHKAGAKRLILFHHDPSRTDAEVQAIQILCQDLAQKRGSDVIIEAAKENSEFDF